MSRDFAVWKFTSLYFTSIMKPMEKEINSMFYEEHICSLLIYTQSNLKMTMFFCSISWGEISLYSLLFVGECFTKFVSVFILPLLPQIAWICNCKGRFYLCSCLENEKQRSTLILIKDADSRPIQVVRFLLIENSIDR